MSNTEDKQKTGARESAGLKDDCGTQSPQGTPRSCNKLGASPSNTAPAKYIDKKNTLPLRCAVDSLYISYRGNILPQIEELLTVVKKQAQHLNKEVAAEAYISFAGHKFEVKPKGAGRFSFVLSDNWFTIQLSSGESTSMPLAYIQISSELLTFTKIDEVLSHLDNIVYKLGKVKGHPSVSRLDLCMDFMPLPQFKVEAIDIQQWKTRASQIDRFHQHKRPSGWRIGKGVVMGRLYNKTLEIVKSKKDYLKPIWEAQGWDGKTDVWRMEFQMKREFLKNVGLMNPYQINELSPALWKYATTKWLQLVNPTTDSNESRWPINDAWKDISDSCTNSDCDAVKVVTKRRLPNDQFLFVNGLAAISSFMAREGITDLGEALGEFLHQAEDYHLTVKDKPIEDYLKGKAKEKTLRYNTELKE
ncbi:hypothetical protein [Thiomicrorhabdus sp. Milos-T2]|uniref:hypothetical protein n=1 Tax=Thiomicrorhabdus sp. Milos-T2 TaxID=90814 RepID=UPI00068F5090|nr:hypothetical protein [Thiomicrorhabdus sp. Milos-T2]